MTPDDRVALLRTAMRQMPELRQEKSEASDVAGTVLYEATLLLTKRKLPLTEDDLIELLDSARHDCGHGADTRAPFDLARDFQRRNGWSRRLADGLHSYVASLPDSQAVIVKELHRAGDLLEVLDAHRPVDPRAQRWWITSVRCSLAELPADEVEVWRSLVLEMSVTDRMTSTKKWNAAAARAIDALSVDLVHQRFNQWWPDPADGPKLWVQGSGAQLLKHFIWMCDQLDRTIVEPLVTRIAAFDWPKSRRPLAVIKPSVAYLAPSSEPETKIPLATLERLV